MGYLFYTLYPIQLFRGEQVCVPTKIFIEISNFYRNFFVDKENFGTLMDQRGNVNCLLKSGINI
jgi:hypothetical protein